MGLCAWVQCPLLLEMCVCVQTSMGGFTAHDYVCNTIKENGIICVEKMEAGVAENFSSFEITKPILLLYYNNQLNMSYPKLKKLEKFEHKIRTWNVEAQ